MPNGAICLRQRPVTAVTTLLTQARLQALHISHPCHHRGCQVRPPPRSQLPGRRQPRRKPQAEHLRALRVPDHQLRQRYPRVQTRPWHRRRHPPHRRPQHHQQHHPSRLRLLWCHQLCRQQTLAFTHAAQPTVREGSTQTDRRSCVDGIEKPLGAGPGLSLLPSRLLEDSKPRRVTAAITRCYQARHLPAIPLLRQRGHRPGHHLQSHRPIRQRRHQQAPPTRRPQVIHRRHRPDSQ